MHLPGPLRAVVGLAATAATEAKHLPDRAIELPMLVISSALQASLRTQQRYARLAARGDEVLNRRTPTEEPPPWATFDEPVSLDELRRSVESSGDGSMGRTTFENLFGVEDPTLDPDGREPVDEILPPDEPPPDELPQTGPPTEGRADAKGSKKRAAKKAAAEKAAPKKAAAKKAAAKKKPAQPTQDASAGADALADPAGERAKTVSKPRHTAPSAFDNVADDTDS